MAFCAQNCSGLVPVLGINPCGIQTRGGGISRFVFATCDLDLNPVLENISNWAQAISACKLRATGEVVGAKTKGSFEKRRIASCLPEAVIGGEKSITFQDFNATQLSGQNPQQAALDIRFWNQILTNPAGYQVGWLTCDGLFYGFYRFALEVDEVIEDSRKGKSFKDGTITLDMIQIPEPIALPAPIIDQLLNSALVPNCG